MNVTNGRIEIRVEISVSETPLEAAEALQKCLKRAGITTELAYVGTFGKR